jgi:acetoacetyl-CoA synthetase
VTHSLTISITETITEIWQRLFQRSEVGVDDNFFRLGGNPHMAAQLFSEIAKISGRELSPLTIYQAPTIASLASVLEQSSPVRVLPLLRLKEGNAAPPVFITHGIGSSVMDFFELVRHIDTPHPIFGMQAPGMDGVAEPLDRIEDMAQFFLDAIKTMQPRGPYLLIGYSLGGLITLEMARRLDESGEKVALLALLETYPHRQYLPVGPRLQLSSRLVRHHASAMMKLPARGVVPYIFGGSEQRWKALQDVGESEGNSPSSLELSTPATRRVTEKAYAALASYRPRAYAGRTRFAKAAVSLRFPENAAAVWADLLPRLEVEIVPGTHQGIITREFKSLGSVLSRYLNEASVSERQ